MQQMIKKLRSGKRGIDTDMFFPSDSPLRLNLYEGSPMQHNRQATTQRVTITTRCSKRYWNTRVFYNEGGNMHQMSMGGSDYQRMTLADASHLHYQLEEEIEKNYRFPNNPLIVNKSSKGAQFPRPILPSEK